MKLADALSLRKALSLKVSAGLISPDLILPRITDQRIAPAAAPDLSSIPVTSVTDFCGEILFYRQALLAVENAVEAANFETSLTVPTSIFTEFGVERAQVQEVSKTLAQLLRRRVYLTGLKRDIEDIRIRALKQPDVKRTPMPDRANAPALDLIQIRTNKYDLKEMNLMVDYYAKQLRLVDSHVQQANWSVEVSIHERWTKSYFELSLETSQPKGDARESSTPPLQRF